MALLVDGLCIKDTYEVEAFLGEGAFAEVYRVRHKFLGRQAIKLFKAPGWHPRVFLRQNVTSLMWDQRYSPFRLVRNRLRAPVKDSMFHGILDPCTKNHMRILSGPRRGNLLRQTPHSLA